MRKRKMRDAMFHEVLILSLNTKISKVYHMESSKRGTRKSWALGRGRHRCSLRSGDTRRLAVSGVQRREQRRGERHLPGRRLPRGVPAAQLRLQLGPRHDHDNPSGPGGLPVDLHQPHHQRG